MQIVNFMALAPRVHPWLRLASLAMLLLFPFALAGCVDSAFLVPYPAGQIPSALWSADSRTQGWDSVHVEYWFLSDGSVKAFVRSGDGKHHFTELGSVQQHKQQDGTIHGYASDHTAVLTFHGMSEQYQFVPRQNDRTWMLVHPELPEQGGPTLKE